MKNKMQIDKEVPEGWDLLPFGEMAELVKDGYRPTGTDNLAYIGLEHISQQSLSLNSIGHSTQVESNKFFFRSGDILFGKLRPYFRKVYRPRFDGVCSTDIWVVRAKEDIDQGFLFYLMANQDFVDLASSGSSGTRMPRADWDYLKDLLQFKPDYDEQRAIGKILSNLDEKIELNQRMIKTLESIAQALFKRWFVDFDFPDNRGRPYKSSGGKMVESDYGEIPEGWSYSLAGSVSTIGIGRTPPRKEHEWFSENPADVRWVSIRDMGNVGVFIEKTAEYLTAEAVKKFNVFLVPDNTPLLSFKLTVGRVAMTDGEMVTNEAIAYFLSKHECVTNYYLYLYLKGFDYQSLGSTSSIATAFNSDTVRNMPILLPSKKIADEFFKSVSRFFDLIKFKEKEIVVLTEVRDSLLPKLMTGEVRVNSGRLS